MSHLDLFEIGKLIRQHRRWRRLTQQEVAAAAGCTKQLILLLEDGRVPTVSYRVVLAAMNKVGLDLRVVDLVQRRPTLEDVQAQAELDDAPEREAVWGGPGFR
ncbi:helix-turn-helix domain-containing protein [Methylobacterium sp. E-005]|uniref:helix-turn-helix domain-containing protein n=1 Tax=Methylobacterium sp. E-005 TaxID=2836549 RepID=UPI001FBC011C|nr:helix-turn-helix transcriptional regulator [Methylobacterium sp. E-005]MCJ2088550.1 helix-turn-helix domain-containing protein [Methylobacterium sp. E-005]